MVKKPSKLTENLLVKKRRSGKVAFGDSEQGVQELIRARTAYDPLAITEIVREPDSEGVWTVAFRSGRRLKAYVGKHPSAPDFEILRDKPDAK